MMQGPMILPPCGSSKVTTSVISMITRVQDLERGVVAGQAKKWLVHSTSAHTSLLHLIENA